MGFLFSEKGEPMRVSAIVALVLCACLQVGCTFRPSAGQNQNQIGFSDEPADLPLHWKAHAREILGKRLARQLKLDHQDPQKIVDLIRDEIHRRHPQFPVSMINRILRSLISSSNRHELDPMLLLAMIIQESGIRPNAIGRHGELGLMQLKLETARWLTKQNLRRQELLRPEVNIEVGAAYLGYLRSNQGRAPHRYISAYNSGPSPKARRNVKYRSSVMSHYQRLIRSLVARSTPPVAVPVPAADRLITFRMKD
jgi:soluble lytic murein transglycosylase